MLTKDAERKYASYLKLDPGSRIDSEKFKEYFLDIKHNKKLDYNPDNVN